MIKGFKMKLYEGQEAEYERRHNLLWPEMKDMIHEHGGKNYTIFLDRETLTLFGYIEIEDEELSKIKLSMREWNQKVIERCRILPFSRIFEEYEEVKIAGEKYMLSIYDLESYIRNYNVSENRIAEIEESEIKILLY